MSRVKAMIVGVASWRMGLQVVAERVRQVRLGQARSAIAWMSRHARRFDRRPRNSDDVSGLVERMSTGEIVGWVHAPTDRFPVRVALLLNELEVAATWADDPSRHNATGAIRHFRFAVTDLWDFCRKTDRISVRVDGRPLPIHAKGVYKRPGRDGSSTEATLRRKLDSGYVLSQYGRLQLRKGLDRDWQRRVVAIYTAVDDLLKQHFGYQAFAMYGTLLGAVRDGDFIGHDIDFDAGYLSDHTDGASAAGELRDIAIMLVQHGFDVECKRTALHIHDADDPTIRIDLFHLYFDVDGELAIPFGYAGPRTLRRPDWTGLTETKLAGHPIRIPRQAEKLVEYLYGSSWRRPIPGFRWDRARIGWDAAGRMPDSYREEVYWANFYARQGIGEPSTFCSEILTMTELPTTVLDIGCGTGRDSFAFARAGRAVLGVDRAGIAISKATDTAASRQPAGRLTFDTADVSSDDDIARVLSHAREIADGGPVLVYMRFFLHSLPAEVQDGLLRAIASWRRPGDALAAEFRTTDDEDRPKAFGGHFRRYQDGGEFARRLDEEYGFAVHHEQEGRGLSPFRDEDPALYRVVAFARPIAPAPGVPVIPDRPERTSITVGDGAG